MATADKRIPVTEETKELVDDRKPDGMTYDLWLRRLMGEEPPVGGAG